MKRATRGGIERLRTASAAADDRVARPGLGLEDDVLGLLVSRDPLRNVDKLPVEGLDDGPDFWQIAVVDIGDLDKGTDLGPQRRRINPGLRQRPLLGVGEQFGCGSGNYIAIDDDQIVSNLVRDLGSTVVDCLAEEA